MVEAYLKEVFLSPEEGPLAPSMERLIADATHRTGLFLESRPGLPGFVPSDFRVVAAAILALREGRYAAGDRFCEWGSGFGVAACLAAMAGFHACGIEIQDVLVEEAEELAAAHGLDVEFACGTFIPPGGEDCLDEAGEFDWLLSGGACGYEILDLDPEGIDVVFAYPWPGEEPVLVALFERYACVGALLLTYHGAEGIRVRRKVAPGPPSRNRGR